MIRKWEPLDDYLEEELLRSYLRMPLRHLASELMEEMGYHSEADLQHAMVRAFEVCCSMHINIPQHFRQVYVFDKEGIHTDWQLTDLASYLLLINGNSCNARVAEAQLYFLRNRSAGI